jgi:hypothetical protein
MRDYSLDINDDVATRMEYHRQQQQQQQQQYSSSRAWALALPALVALMHAVSNHSPSLNISSNFAQAWPQQQQVFFTVRPLPHILFGHAFAFAGHHRCKRSLVRLGDWLSCTGPVVNRLYLFARDSLRQ